MKVLFLDIDGVLNSRRYFLKLVSLLVLPDDKLDPDAIKLLNQITDVTGAFIVVSSTWRYGYINNIAGLREMLAKHGVTGKVLGITPVDNRQRGAQIQDWMDNCGRQIDSFVILDDDNDMGRLDKFLVKTTFQDGLQDVHVQAAVDILNK